MHLNSYYKGEKPVCRAGAYRGRVRVLPWPAAQHPLWARQAQQQEVRSSYIVLLKHFMPGKLQCFFKSFSFKKMFSFLWMSVCLGQIYIVLSNFFGGYTYYIHYTNEQDFFFVNKQYFFFVNKQYFFLLTNSTFFC